MKKIQTERWATRYLIAILTMNGMNLIMQPQDYARRKENKIISKNSHTLCVKHSVTLAYKQSREPTRQACSLRISPGVGGVCVDRLELPDKLIS